jgi:hypothetical protein
MGQSLKHGVTGTADHERKESTRSGYHMYCTEHIGFSIAVCFESHSRSMTRYFVRYHAFDANDDRDDAVPRRGDSQHPSLTHWPSGAHSWPAPKRSTAPPSTRGRTRHFYRRSRQPRRHSRKFCSRSKGTRKMSQTRTTTLPFASPDSISRCASRMSSNPNTLAGFAR